SCQLRCSPTHPALLSPSHAVDEARLEPGPWLATVDMLVLAAPTQALPGLAAALLPHLSAGAVVTDVGSVKRPVVEALARVPWAEIGRAHVCTPVTRKSRKP